MHQLSHTIFMHCLSPVNVQLSSCLISGVRVAPCSISISRSNLLWLVFVRQRFSLISAWLGPSNELNYPVVRLMLYIKLKRDCSLNWFLLVFRPLFRLLFGYLLYLLGLTTRRMFRLCSESFNHRRLN
jgi:hypothetical protein